MFRSYSKLWLINISLAVCVVFFGIMRFDVWSKGDETIQKIQTGKSSEKPLPEKMIIERPIPPESSYGIVAEKNLFSSNRAEFIPEKPKPGPESGPLKISEKLIFLYGVVLTDDRKMALISNPEPGSQAGKKPVKDKWVKVGDTMGNFSVTDIRKDRIVLADGTSTHEILLYDKNKPTRKIVAEKPTTPTGGAAGSAVAATATKSDNQPPTTGGAEGKSASAPAGSVEGKSASAGEYKIINTPFGPTKRRIQ